jgi:hypothetical protein
MQVKEQSSLTDPDTPGVSPRVIHFDIYILNYFYFGVSLKNEFETLI